MSNPIFRCHICFMEFDRVEKLAQHYMYKFLDIYDNLEEDTQIKFGEDLHFDFGIQCFVCGAQTHAK